METKISTVAIAGAGTMGQGIALACAMAGYTTRLYDIQPAACVRALQQINLLLDQLVAKNKLSAAGATALSNKITASSERSQLQANVVVEAIAENLLLKQNLLKEAEQLNQQQALLVSNTSSLSVTEIASVLTNPGLCAGLHFFNPAHILKLVEVVVGQQTARETISRLSTFAQSLGKTVVVAKDSPGFIVNRVARPFYTEALYALEHQAASPEAIDALLRSAGFKMGPFELMDLIGMDVNYAVTESVWQGLNKPARFTPANVQKEKIEKGELGRKSGKGFYTYPQK
ncbi:MAG: 3-hydroxybutyryl-CoA dehydrogenase [Cyclobacteriaceae bacterium]|nr:3-hydroxybutyryl-CoA dehydrogenase [Cyclobacteriaceae bacterium]